MLRELACSASGGRAAGRIADFIVQVRAGAYSIEAANPRHEHEWRVWQGGRLPKGRILIPGVITHHTITVEHPRLVADRIIRYAKIVGPENVIAGHGLRLCSTGCDRTCARAGDVG